MTEVDWTPERLARAALTYICEAGNADLGEAIAQRGAVDVVAALRASDQGGAWPQRARAIDDAGLPKLAAQHGLRFIMPGDAEWPAALDDLDHARPVQGLGGRPHGLWLKGPGQLADWVGASVAIVGSRAATHYGELVATDLAAELAVAGSGAPALTIISGGAYGIDAAAHRGAVAVGGRTVAIQAGGLDEYYPKGNAGLFDKLAAEQLLVSEVPPGLRPTRVGFLARNRLIAALSVGTIVVEAAARSGARNTAHWAGELGRPVMAVPGSVHSAASVTPHRLIRDGEAVLVASPDDVRAVLAPLGAGPKLAEGGAQRPLDLLTPEQFAVRESLPARGALGIGEIALASGQAPRECAIALGELEDLGHVVSAGNGAWRLAG